MKTDMMYEVLYGYSGLAAEGVQLNGVKEVADFIHTQHCGYIAEADGTTLLEFENGEIDECTDMRFRDELMAELRKGEGFEDRYLY